ncbi:hypothetical protein LB543_26820 [Mesorhizobium sp. ESP7-2]|uniref:hypothetical protein n=1 Tax=Mesorhizobium sp. ESP7-2 TaxID=2876622 RepID=UPI001CCFDEF3|nr:hypothetical protein [Mesorhizobium sp. ESP7-2]MBZ9710323.1 hypothetical protein [Mesorhizobium sp. ESP7-2]
MSISSETLTGYQRAEFKKAAKRRVFLFVLQLLIAVPAAASVVVTDDFWVYVLAIAGFLLLILWWIAFAIYQRARSAAQAARRAALLIGGLGGTLSPDATLAFRRAMTVTEGTAANHEKSDYYATSFPVGPSRLGEMIEESAFYSANLQRISSFVMLAVLLFFAIAFAIVAFAALPFIGHATTMTILRIFLAVLVFALSSDVLGACLSHRAAARDIEAVRNGLQLARRDGFRLTDVLLLLGEYNVAVETAPESVPYAYEVAEKGLNKLWAEYLKNIQQLSPKVPE